MRKNLTNCRAFYDSRCRLVLGFRNRSTGTGATGAADDVRRRKLAGDGRNRQQENQQPGIGAQVAVGRFQQKWVASIRMRITWKAETTMDSSPLT